MQLKTISHQHNNVDSQEHFDNNEEAYQNQCRRVLTVFESGKTLTVRQADREMDISHLPRRVCTLRAMGYDILSRRLAGGFVEYYLQTN